MKFAVFACLLVVAGAYASPEEVDVAYAFPEEVDVAYASPEDVDVAYAFPEEVDVAYVSPEDADVAYASPQEVDVAPSQERVVDLYLMNWLESVRSWIVFNGLDPLHVPKHIIDYTIIDGLVELFGEVLDLRVDGGSGIYWNFLNYNLLLGRLDFDIVMPQISGSVGKYEVEGRYGDRGGRAKLSGSLVVSDIRLRGNALLRLDPGPRVTIYNINVDFGIGDIEAEVKALWQCRACAEPEDISEALNELINVTFKELLVTYKYEIDTLWGELIRYIVNWRF